jgi:hypothetical protein
VVQRILHANRRNVAFITYANLLGAVRNVVPAGAGWDRLMMRQAVRVQLDDWRAIQTATDSSLGDEGDGNMVQQEGKQQGPTPASANTIFALPEAVLSTREGGCGICQDDMAVGDTVTTFPCGHMFHLDCAVDGLHFDRRCCMCRHELHSPPDSGTPSEADEKDTGSGVGAT